MCNDSSKGAHDGRGAGLIPAYAGQTNSFVLEAIFPEFFEKPAANEFRDYSERMAQLYALTVLSDTDISLLPSASVKYTGFNNQFYANKNLFPCTQALLTIVYRFGRFPSPAEMPTGCPTS
jgi:hypothetical protein